MSETRKKKKRSLAEHARFLVAQVQSDNFIDIDLTKLELGYDINPRVLQTRVREALCDVGLKDRFAVTLNNAHLIVVEKEFASPKLLEKAMVSRSTIVTSKHFEIDKHSAIAVRAFADLLRESYIESLQIKNTTIEKLTVMYPAYIKHLELDEHEGIVMLTKKETASVNDEANY